MQKSFKRCFRTIAFLCLLTLLIQFTSAASLSIDPFSTAKSAETYVESLEEGLDPPQIVEEDTSKREQYIKHFRKSDNSYVAVMYDEPVYFWEKGTWREIDNTLSPTFLAENFLAEDFPKTTDLSAQTKALSAADPAIGYWENSANSLKVQLPSVLTGDRLSTQNQLSKDALWEGDALAAKKFSSLDEAYCRPFYMYENGTAIPVWQIGEGVELSNSWFIDAMTGEELEVDQ